MNKAGALRVLAGEIAECRKCARLVAYRERVAREKRRAYCDWEYWGRPVPGFGDAQARLLILGLAPGAHGANRTGRMFTGDRSGDFLYAALHKAGFANQAASLHREDGLRLKGAYISATIRCAPPQNKPLPGEIAACRGYLERELELLQPRAILALGRIAWDGYLALFQQSGRIARRGAFPFTHGAEAELPGGLPRLFGAYHPSQQNTQTGRVTAAMYARVLRRLREFLSEQPSAAAKPGASLWHPTI